MSSISPIVTAELAAAVNAKGGLYLDAPVSGGQIAAKAASLTIMIGGPTVAFERAKPLFELMGKNITLIAEHNGGADDDHSGMVKALEALAAYRVRLN